MFEDHPIWKLVSNSGYKPFIKGIYNSLVGLITIINQLLSLSDPPSTQSEVPQIESVWILKWSPCPKLLPLHSMFTKFLLQRSFRIIISCWNCCRCHVIDVSDVSHWRWQDCVSGFLSWRWGCRWRWQWWRWWRCWWFPANLPPRLCRLWILKNLRMCHQLRSDRIHYWLKLGEGHFCRKHLVCFFYQEKLSFLESVSS